MSTFRFLILIAVGGGEIVWRSESYVGPYLSKKNTHKLLSRMTHKYEAFIADRQYLTNPHSCNPCHSGAV
jgi:hypothetical protein